MRKVKDAIDLKTGEKVYFRGHAQATYMSDGRTVEEAVKSGGGGSYDDTEIKEDISELQQKDAQTDTKLTELSAETETIRTEVESQSELIEDLQNTKIDRENDDYYPKMAVGLADNLSGVDVVDSEVNFRRSGGGAITDGMARIESIKGNSVVWNQHSTIIQKAVHYEPSSNTEYLLIGNIPYYISAINNHSIFAIMTGAPVGLGYLQDNKQNDIAKGGKIYVANTSRTNYTNVYLSVSPSDTDKAFDAIISVLFVDLTKMFGSGNEPTTIEEFYARIPMGVDMNAYNEGEVIHMDVQSIKSVGINQWDEQWEKGKFSTTDGTNQAADGTMRMVNKVAVLPNSAYYFKSPVDTWVLFYDKDGKVIEGYSTGINSYQNACNVKNVTFTTPSNAASMRAYFNQYFANTTTYNHDICINISDTSINGKYFPYIKRMEDLSIIRKYFPEGMKSAGSAHDEIRYNKASGKWEKVVRIGKVKMKDLKWAFNGGTPSRFSALGATDMVSAAGVSVDLMCKRYSSASSATATDKSIYRAGAYIGVWDSAYSDLASFTASLTDEDILYYQLAEPIVTELDAEDQFKDLDYQVWNCGTEKAIADGKSAPLAADITYGFNAIGKIKELESLVAALRAKVGI